MVLQCSIQLLELLLLESHGSAPVIESALVKLTRFGATASTPLRVLSGVAFFAVAFPVGFATSEGQPGGDMYTEEIRDYEDSALVWTGGGGGMVI